MVPITVVVLAGIAWGYQEKRLKTKGFALKAAHLHKLLTACIYTQKA